MHLIYEGVTPPPEVLAEKLCFGLSLFEAIVELHVVDEKMLNDFLIGK